MVVTNGETFTDIVDRGEFTISVFVDKSVIVKVVVFLVIMLTVSIPQLSVLPLELDPWIHLKLVLVVWAATGIGCAIFVQSKI